MLRDDPREPGGEGPNELERAEFRALSFERALQQTRAERELLLQEIARLRGEVEGLAAHQDALLRSNSWRLTRPLRGMGRAARRAFRW